MVSKRRQEIAQLRKDFDQLCKIMDQHKKEIIENSIKVAQMFLLNAKREAWRAGIPDATVLHGESKRRRTRPSKPKLIRVI